MVLTVHEASALTLSARVSALAKSALQIRVFGHGPIPSFCTHILITQDGSQLQRVIWPTPWPHMCVAVFDVPTAKYSNYHLAVYIEPT